MTWARPWALSLLALVPLIFIVLIVEARLRRKSLERFADPGLLERLSGQAAPGRSFLKGLFFILAAVCAVIGLAGPRWGSHDEVVRHRGVDIMVLLDTSRSMLAKDVSPTRMERARREVYDLVRVLNGDRLGLTAFAGTAFMECPLTLDYAALEMFLGDLNTDSVPVPGTDLGTAIETGMKGFDFKTITDKVMILITDGEDNEGRGGEAAKEAARKGVRIYVYGIGSEEGAPVPAPEGGGFMKDPSGGIVMSRLVETSLREIAARTGGKYVRSVTGDLDLDLLYFAGIKASTTARELGTKKIRVFEERFQVFTFAACVLLLLEWVIPRRREGGEP